LSAIMLEDFKLSGSSGTYIDAMYSVLSHKGWFQAPKHMLAGMTAMAFRFTVHRRLSGESMTAYNWVAEHFLAADFIGISSSSKAGYSFAPTFPLYQQHAVAAIRESIDRGTGAIFWRDAFVVACGYDGEREVLYYVGGSDCFDSTAAANAASVKALPYADFGRNVSPYWYYQINESLIELDLIGIYKESLMQAINRWEAHDLLLPEEDYACGNRAYEALRKLCRSGVYDRAEAYRVISGYAACKRDIMLYTRSLRNLWPGMGDAADLYSELSASFDLMVETAQSVAAAEQPASVKELTQALAHRLSEASKIEDQAVRVLRTIMRETLDNRFHDISLR
jgi:hypothetical protein